VDNIVDVPDHLGPDSSSASASGTVATCRWQAELTDSGIAGMESATEPAIAVEADQVNGPGVKFGMHA
jgi:hypothetical protein